MKKSCKRTMRQHPGRSRLMPREVEGLVFIAEAQPVATSVYQERLGVSVAVARRSLRKLRNHGLVNVFVTAQEVPSHFALTKRGAVLLAETLDRRIDEFHVLRGIGKLPLRHHDVGAHLAASLYRAVHQNEGIVLESFLTESSIRRSRKLSASTQIPDAVAVLRNQAGQRLAWAIEIDLATESPAYVARHKGKPYADLQAHGTPLLNVVDWRVLCVVPTEQRMKRLVAALWEAGVPEAQWYFTIAREVCAETVFSSAWRTVRTMPGGTEAALVGEVPLPVCAVLTDGNDDVHGEER